MAENQNPPALPPEREKPVTAPPRRRENLFKAEVTFRDEDAPRTIALDIAGSRRAVSDEVARDYFENRLGPAGDVVKVENVRRVNREEVGPTPAVPVVRAGQVVGESRVGRPAAKPAAPANG